jgi:demethylphylloquinol methyltransferase
LKSLTVKSIAPPAQEIQALFDRIAPAYDRLNDQLSLGLHRVWKQMAMKWSDPPLGANCLDVCCGSGDLARLLAQRVGSTGQVVGLDFSAAQLAIAQQKPNLLSAAPIHWVKGDAMSLPFEANQFDAITMGYGLRNVTDIPCSLRELHRVLKPSAKAAILDFHRPDNLQLRAFQQWYLNTFVVPMAESMGLREDYAYISPSLDRFPTGAEQVELARQAGFAKAIHYAIAGGLMGVLVATK